MQIHHYRYHDSGRSTLGVMKIDGEFACHTLENPWRDNQRSVSCIPAGSYEVKLRTVGGFHTRYQAKFSDMHHGMLELTGVPDRDFILIHVGNYPHNTEGCILVGGSADTNYIGKSTAVYKNVYRRIADALTAGEKVTYTIHETNGERG